MRRSSPGAEIVACCRGPYCVHARQAVSALRRHGLNARRLEGGTSGVAGGRTAGSVCADPIPGFVAEKITWRTERQVVQLRFPPVGPGAPTELSRRPATGLKPVKEHILKVAERQRATPRLERLAVAEKVRNLAFPSGKGTDATGPQPSFTLPQRCCGAARRTRHSLRMRKGLCDYNILRTKREPASWNEVNDLRR